MRPEELARRLGISGKSVRGWLRRTYPRGPHEHNQHWFLTDEQVRAARSHFADLPLSPADSAWLRSDATGRHRLGTGAVAPSSTPSLSTTSLTTNHTALQRAYAPKELRVLFVGESPPASGKYFYAGNSMLYAATRDAFEQALGCGGEGGFLECFQQLGCYLTDLSAVSVNQLPVGSPERVAARRTGIPALAEAIRTRKPPAIVGVLLDIEPEIRESLKASGESPAVHLLPFPRGQDRTRFVRLLAELLTRFREIGYLGRGVVGD